MAMVARTEQINVQAEQSGGRRAESWLPRLSASPRQARVAAAKTTRPIGTLFGKAARAAVAPDRLVSQ